MGSEGAIRDAVRAGTGGAGVGARWSDAGSFDPFGSFDQYHWTDVARLTSSKAAPSHGRVTETPAAPRSVAACAGERTQRDLALCRCAPRGSRFLKNVSTSRRGCFSRQRLGMIRAAVLVAVGTSAWTGTGCGKGKELRAAQGGREGRGGPRGRSCTDSRASRVPPPPSRSAVSVEAATAPVPLLAPQALISRGRGCRVGPNGRGAVSRARVLLCTGGKGAAAAGVRHGWGAALHCDSCDPGTCSANGASVCTYCAAGKSTTPNGRALSDGGCHSCDAGTFSTGRGVGDAETCSACGVHVRLLCLGSLHLVHQMRPRKIVELRGRTKRWHL